MNLNIMPLEERIVLDAAGLDGDDNNDNNDNDAQDSADNGDGDDSGDDSGSDGDDSGDGDGDGDDGDGQPSEVDVLVVDTSVESAESLASLSMQDVLTVLFDSSTDSADDILADILDALDGQLASSITFVTDTDLGDVDGWGLTSDFTFTSSDFDTNADLVSFWGDIGTVMTDDGYISLFDQDISYTDAGQELIQYVAEASDTNVVSNAGWMLSDDSESGFLIRASTAAVDESDLPDSQWWYGCAPTSAGMLLGYYDRVGYEGVVYDDLVAGGTCNLNNWSDYFNSLADYDMSLLSSMIASTGHISSFFNDIDDGIDGDGVVGSGVGDSGDDIAGRTYADFDCLADFMGTSQDQYGSENGSSWVYFTSYANTLANMKAAGYTVEDDFLVGLEDYVQYCGYDLSDTDTYNQMIDARVGGGFSFAEFQAQIDAGKPMLLHFYGHTTVAYGYQVLDTNGDGVDEYYVQFDNTWADQDGARQMIEWGEAYQGMQMMGVTVVTLGEGAPQGTADYYVDVNATTGNNSGASWTNAFTDLQDALDQIQDDYEYAMQYNLAWNGVEVWIADGTYTMDAYSNPDTDHAWEETSFELVNGVTFYGGFQGYDAGTSFTGEYEVDQRDITANQTILSGYYDNGGVAWHVVDGAADATLDGFYIINGNADGDGEAATTDNPGGDGTASNDGAGLYIGASDTGMTVANCIFSNNTATGGTDGSGGAIYVGAVSTIQSCIFNDNTADFGGAVYMNAEGAEISGGEFDDNTAYSGGAIYVAADASIVGAYIGNIDGDATGNRALYGMGGGIYSDDAALTVNLSRIFGNYTIGVKEEDPVPTPPIEAVPNGLGGGIYLDGGSLNMDSTIVAENTAEAAAGGSDEDGYGGGIYSDGASLHITSSVFYGNVAINGAGVYVDGGSGQFINNTFHANDASGLGGAVYVSGAPVSFYNNIFTANVNAVGNDLNHIYATGEASVITMDNNYAEGLIITYDGQVLDTWSLSSTTANPVSVTLAGLATAEGVVDGANYNETDYNVGYKMYGADGALGGGDDELGGAIGDDNTWGTTDDGLQLNASSSLVNRGNNDYVPDDALDVLGMSRAVDGSVDIGAFEKHYIIFVDPDGDGSNGASWETAYQTLQDAIDAAQQEVWDGGRVDEIYIADGVYTLTSQEETFALLAGVAVYGGFGGVSETNLAIKYDVSRRDTDENKTVLSGNIDTDSDGVTDLNAYHVLTAITDGIRLDNFAYGGGDEAAESVTVDSQGRILVAGRVQNSDGATYSMAVIRYNMDGTIDTTFGENGTGLVVIEAAAGISEMAYDITYDWTNDRIYLAGSSSQVDGDIMIARLDIDGELDTDFDTDGISYIDIGAADVAYSVEVDAAGRVYVGGEAGGNAIVARVLADDLDVDSSLVTALNWFIAPDIQTTAGSLDVTFGAVYDDINITSLMLQGAGYDESYAGHYYFRDGYIDLGAGTINDIVVTYEDIDSSGTIVSDLDLGDYVATFDEDCDGEMFIYAAGGNGTAATLDKINEIGDNTSAGNVGWSQTYDVDAGGPDVFNSLDVVSDGGSYMGLYAGSTYMGYEYVPATTYIVVAGSTNDGADTDMLVGLIDATDGSTVNTFDGDGFATVGFDENGNGADEANSVTAVWVDADDDGVRELSEYKLMVAGYSTTEQGFALARLSLDGTLDTTFGDDFDGDFLADGKLVTDLDDDANLPGNNTVDTANAMIIGYDLLDMLAQMGYDATSIPGFDADHMYVFGSGGDTGGKTDVAIVAYRYSDGLIDTRFDDGAIVVDGVTVTGGAATGDASGSTSPGDEWLQYGGGIYIKGATDIWLSDIVFSDNYSVRGGGVYYEYADGYDAEAMYYGDLDGQDPLYLDVDKVNLWITNCIFSGNYATNSGGGLAIRTGSAYIANTVFSGNSAGWGGAISNYNNSGGGGYLWMETCTIIGNTAQAGGGIELAEVDDWAGLVMYNSTISHNDADTVGGGILLQPYAHAKIVNSVLWGDTAGNANGVGQELYSVSGGSYYLNDGFYAGNLDSDYTDIANNWQMVNTAVLLIHTAVDDFYNDLTVNDTIYDSNGNDGNILGTESNEITDPLINNWVFYGRWNTTATYDETTGTTTITYDPNETRYQSYIAVDGVVVNGTNNNGTYHPLYPLFAPWTDDSHTGNITSPVDLSGWYEDEFVGMYLNPDYGSFVDPETGEAYNPQFDTDNYQQFLIVGNTESSITVVGDASQWAVKGNYFTIHDYHLVEGSAAAQAGTSYTYPSGTIVNVEPDTMRDVLGSWYYSYSDGTIYEIAYGDSGDVDGDGIYLENYPIDITGALRMPENQKIYDLGAFAGTVKRGETNSHTANDTPTRVSRAPIDIILYNDNGDVLNNYVTSGDSANDLYVTVPENSPSGYVVAATMSGIDADGNAIFYSIADDLDENGFAGQRFRVTTYDQGATWRLEVNTQWFHSLDYEVRSSYNITIAATDSAGQDYYEDFTVYIVDDTNEFNPTEVIVTDNETGATGMDLNISEGDDIVHDVEIGDLIAADADRMSSPWDVGWGSIDVYTERNDWYVYSVVIADGSFVDADNPYGYAAFDDQGNAVNVSGWFSFGYWATPTSLGWHRAYSTIYRTAATNLDFEESSYYDINIRVQDAEGRVMQDEFGNEIYETIRFTIDDANDRPTGILLDNDGAGGDDPFVVGTPGETIVVNENDLGAVIGELSMDWTTDQDLMRDDDTADDKPWLDVNDDDGFNRLDETHTYSIRLDDGTYAMNDGTFEIGQTVDANGDTHYYLKVMDGVYLDHEVQDTYVLYVRVTDNAGATQDVEFTVNVTDTNDAPSLTGNTDDVEGAYTNNLGANPLDEDLTIANNVGLTVEEFLNGTSAATVIGTDQDGDDVGIAVTSWDDTIGTWEYWDGGAWVSFQSLYTAQIGGLGASPQTPALLFTHDTVIRFNTDGMNGGDVDITFGVWDETGYANAQLVDVNYYAEVETDPASFDAYVNVDEYNSATDGNSETQTELRLGYNFSTAFDASLGDNGAYVLGTQTATLTIIDVNDAPVVNNGGVMDMDDIYLEQGTTHNEGTSVRDIIDSSAALANFTYDDTNETDTNAIFDVDTGEDGNNECIAIYGLDNTNGTWWYKLSGDSAWTEITAAQIASLNDGVAGKAFILSAADSIRFVSNGSGGGAAAEDLDPAISFRAYDIAANAGTIIDYDNTSDLGSHDRTNHLSTLTETVHIRILNSNVSPILDDVVDNMNLTDLDEDTVSATGSLVSDIIADGDANDGADNNDIIEDFTVLQPSSEGLAVVDVDSTDGIWQYSLNGGTSWTTMISAADWASLTADQQAAYTGIVVDAQHGLILDATARVRFTPEADHANVAGAATVGLTVKAWDGAYGTSGEIIDTTVTASVAYGDNAYDYIGQSAFSAGTEVVQIHINGINDAPTGITIDGQDSGSVTEGQAADADAGAAAGSNNGDPILGVLAGDGSLSGIDVDLANEGIVAGTYTFTVLSTTTENGANVVGAFTVDAGGHLVIADNQKVDFETSEYYIVEVQVVDKGLTLGDATDDFTRSYTLRVDVNGISEYNPTDTASSSTGIKEEFAGVAIGSMVTTDRDNGDTFTYVLNTNPNNMFEIVTVGSVQYLKLVDGLTLDYETAEDFSYTLSVTATDSAGMSVGPVDITLNLLDLLDDLNFIPGNDDPFAVGGGEGGEGGAGEGGAGFGGEGESGEGEGAPAGEDLGSSVAGLAASAEAAGEASQDAELALNDAAYALDSAFSSATGGAEAFYESTVNALQDSFAQLQSADGAILDLTDFSAEIPLSDLIGSYSEAVASARNEVLAATAEIQRLADQFAASGDWEAYDEVFEKALEALRQANAKLLESVGNLETATEALKSNTDMLHDTEALKTLIDEAVEQSRGNGNEEAAAAEGEEAA